MIRRIVGPGSDVIVLGAVKAGCRYVRAQVKSLVVVKAWLACALFISRQFRHNVTMAETGQGRDVLCRDVH
jgi:hypothetical protein